MAETKQISIKINLDAKEVDLAKVSINDFQKMYGDAQKKLATLPLGSPEWKKLNDEIKKADNAFQQTKDIVSESESKFKSLRLQIRQATVAFQEAEEKGDLKGMQKAKKQLDDLNDQLEVTTLKSMKFSDALATMPGIAGLVGQSIQGVDKAFKVLVANPILAIITAVVGAFTLLKESLGKTKEGQAALNKVQQAFSTILGPILALINTVAVPIFEKLATIIGKVGSAFTFIAEKLGVSKKSIEAATKDIDKVGQDAAEKEKERLKELQEQREKDEQKRKEANDKAKQAAADKKKRSEDEINDNESLAQSEEELRRSKLKTIEDPIEAAKETQKQKDADFEREKKRIVDLMNVEGVTAEEKKKLQIELNNLEKDYNNDKKERDKDIVAKEKEKADKQAEIKKSLLEVDKTIEEQRQALEKNSLIKQLNEIKTNGQKKIDAYKENLDKLVKEGGLSQEEAAGKLKEFTTLVNQEISDLSQKTLGEDFLNNLDEGLNEFFSRVDNSFSSVVTAIDNSQQKLDEAYKKGLISQKDYTQRSIALENELKNAKQKNIQAVQMLSDATKSLADAFGEETVASKALIKISQLAALTATSMALADAFAGLGKDLKKGFPTNIIAVSSTLLLLGTAISQFKSLVGVNPKDIGKDTPKLAMGGVLQGPTHAMGGITTPFGELEGGEYVINKTSTMMFRPALDRINALGGGQVDYQAQGFAPQSVTSEPPIFKTYVVASEMSSQQEVDRIIKNRSKI